MRLIWETRLKEANKGVFITAVAYREISRGTEQMGPVGTQGVFGFTTSDA
jgi:hypothetical protein